MINPETASLVSRLDFVETTGSTNADLIARAEALPDISVLVADYQSAGKGRAGRDWVAPAGSSLFVSVLVKPGSSVSPSSFSWLPLMAGLSMQRSVAELLSGSNHSVGLKWPNDVLVGTKKISGVLSELVPDLSGVVIGAGLNLTQTAAELPIESATSVSIEAGQLADQVTSIHEAVAEHFALRDRALELYLGQFTSLYASFKKAGGNAVASGLRNEVIEACVSIGLPVRVILPGDTERFGKAVGIDDTGRLIVQPDDSTEVFSVAAGDIVHLRHNY
jgi:BirA family biotin operon repressor/biotin-[acetyl-CoA-carboxylase] ligase